jgi:hypothetical protein
LRDAEGDHGGYDGDAGEGGGVEGGGHCADEHSHGFDDVHVLARGGAEGGERGGERGEGGGREVCLVDLCVISMVRGDVAAAVDSDTEGGLGPLVGREALTDEEVEEGGEGAALAHTSMPEVGG